MKDEIRILGLMMINGVIGVFLVKLLTGRGLPTLKLDLGSWALWSWVILMGASYLAAHIERGIYGLIVSYLRLGRVGSPIVKAAIAGDATRVRELINEGVDVNETDDFSVEKNMVIRGTPLTFASLGGHMAVVKALLDAGADVNRKEEGHPSPLLAACGHGEHKVANVLIEKGAEISASDKYLGFAVLQVVSMLPPQVQGETKDEFEKRKQAHLLLARKILERAADQSSIRDESGKTALDYARESNFTELEELLVGHERANPSGRDDGS